MVVMAFQLREAHTKVDVNSSRNGWKLTDITQYGDYPLVIMGYRQSDRMIFVS